MSYGALELEQARPPAGFVPMAFPGGFGSNQGQIFRHGEGADAVFGMRIAELHCSATGKCHGGWLATFMDQMLPIGARLALPDISGVFLLTVNLTLDYLAPVSVGDWVECRGTVLRQTKRMVFTQGLLSVDGTPVVRGSGIFHRGPEGARIL